MSTVAAAISAGGAIIGGILGRNKAVKPGDVIRQTRAGIEGQASGARIASELYGFNPLTLLGVSQPLVPQVVDNSMMGQSIANAGLAVAQGINEASAQKVYLEQLEEQNKELRKALDRQTLRPKVPGIFGTAQPAAGVAEALSVPVGYGVNPGVVDEIPAQSTRTAYSSPGSTSTTQGAEGIDLEDLGTGVAIEGINEAKDRGDIPQKWEEPYLQAGKHAAAWGVKKLFELHEDVYYKTRGELPPHERWRVGATPYLKFDPFTKDGYYKDHPIAGN